MILSTAFQRNAFQNNAFQIATTITGSGDWKRMALAMLLARPRLKDSPEKEEVEELMAQAQERWTQLTLKPAPYVVTNLLPIVEDMLRAKDRKELEAFRAMLEAMPDD